MATGRGAIEAYLDANPMQAWDRQKWDEYDLAIDTAFHSREIHFSPLMNYVSMPDGADNYYTGRELLRGHTNHNEIGLRQRYIDALYVDTRYKKLVSNKRYGNKAQVWEFDEINNRFGSGSRRWFLEVLRTRLMGGIKEVHEKLSRDALEDWGLHKFLSDGTAFVAATADFSTIDTTSTYKIDVRLLEQVRLRLAERSMDRVQEWGTYASPVPNWPNDILVITTPNVMYDLWNTPEGQFMRDLRELQDERIINGGVARWRGITFVETMWSRLWNVGTITRQVAVIEPINFGDGAPDPDDDDPVDNVYLTGQDTADLKHYVACSDLGTGNFVAGDRVTIHVARYAATDYGIADGVDFTDGQTFEAEIYEVDEATEYITFRQPLPLEFVKAFRYTTLAGAGATGTAYAFITKAQDIHPVYILGGRGMATWAARTKVRVHEPIDNADLPGVRRVTWDEYGEMNRWDLDIFEILYCAASSGGGGGRSAVSVS